MITAFRHTGIVVSDMKVALKFYKDLLHLELIVDTVEESKHIDSILGLSGVRLHIVKLSISKGILLELFQFLKPAFESIGPPVWNIGCSHIAFTVEDIDNMYEKLLRHNINFNCPPTLSPDGSVKYTYCKDPDGTNIELVQQLI